MTILCYHSVEPDWASPLAVTPDAFAAQCDWLARNRQTIPLETAADRLDSGGRLPRGLAALSFDDGFAALHEHAMPVLQRHRLPATVFLVAQTLTPAGQPVDWVDTPGAEPLATLTRDQVLEMQDGGMDFQSHSWAHVDLPELDPDACERDLRQSRELLEDLLKRPVLSLAYPRGRHDEKVRTAATRAGYRHAFALPEQAEVAGPYAVPRVGVYAGNSLATLRLKCTRSYLPVRHHRAVQTLRRRMSAAGP